MRRLAVIVCVVSGVLLTAGAAQAASIPIGGANPNWTDMQKFEWYLGRMAKAAAMCGAYTESGILHRLARMSPYAGIGMAQMRGDGFYGPACVGITADAKGLAADAEKIEAYLEATYGCKGEGCYGQSLNDWQSHACADTLKAHIDSRALDKDEVREVTITSVRHSGATLDYQARVRLKSCQGSFYVDLTDSCRITRDYTRGDCEIAGVDGY